MTDLTFREADHADVAAVVALVESAYRGEVTKSWSVPEPPEQ